MNIEIKKINNNARIPDFAHGSDAGADLYISEAVVINAQSHDMAPTGIAMAIPDGYVGLVFDKSGLAAKNGLTVLGGVIDSGYRGEINVIIQNMTKVDYKFAQGDKVAQLLIQKVEHSKFIEVDNLEDTERGGGGFGSTGK